MDWFWLDNPSQQQQENIFLSPSIILSTISLSVISFLFGRWFNLSILYLLIFLIVYLFTSIRYVKRQLFSSSLPPNNNTTNGIINLLSIRPELRPSWLLFPDNERATFINEFIHTLWPNLGQYLHTFLQSWLNQRIKDSLNSKWIANIICEDFYLGELPPQILGIKGYSTLTNTNSYILDIQIQWIGNPFINLYIYLHYLPKQFGIPISVENIELEGTLRLEIPFTNQNYPYIDNLYISCIHLPRIDLDFRTINFNIMNLPLLHSILEQIFKIGIFRTMLYPLSISIPISSEAKQKQHNVQTGTTVSSSLLTGENTKELSSLLLPTNIPSSLPLNLHPPIMFSITITGLTYQSMDHSHILSLPSLKPKVWIEGCIISFISTISTPNNHKPPDNIQHQLSLSEASTNLHPLYHTRRRSLSLNNLLTYKKLQNFHESMPSSTKESTSISSNIKPSILHRWKTNVQNSFNNISTKWSGLPNTFTILSPSFTPLSSRSIHKPHSSSSIMNSLSHAELWEYAIHKHTNIQSTETQKGNETRFTTVLQFTSINPHSDNILLRIVQSSSSSSIRMSEGEEETKKSESSSSIIGYIRIPCLRIIEEWYMNQGMLPITLTLPIESLSFPTSHNNNHTHGPKPVYTGHITLEIQLQQSITSISTVTNPISTETINSSSSVSSTNNPNTNNTNIFTLQEIEPTTVLSPHLSTTTQTEISTLTTASNTEDIKEKIIHLPPGVAATLEEEAVNNAMTEIVQGIHNTVHNLKDTVKSYIHPSPFSTSTNIPNTTSPVSPLSSNPDISSSSSSSLLPSRSIHKTNGLIPIDTIPLLHITGVHVPSSSSCHLELSSSSTAPIVLSNLPSVALGSLSSVSKEEHESTKKDNES